MIQVVLVHPQIPPNTGNIARLCAATNTPLHLIKPLGFYIDDKSLKRAGLDYWDHVTLQVWDSLQEFLFETSHEPRFFFTRHFGKVFTTQSFPENAWLIFGSETKGIQRSILEEHKSHCLTIPMWGKVRSLNLATSVGIALYETYRQIGYPKSNLE